MPLYEYACKKCGKVFEVMQKMSDTTLTVHEECGGPLERIVSAPALHFKGSGFYITDYAKGSGGAIPPGKSEGAKSDSKSEGSKSEGSKSEGAKSEGSKAKSEGSKSDGSKSDSGSSSATPAPATTSSKSDSKS